MRSGERGTMPATRRSPRGPYLGMGVSMGWIRIFRLFVPLLVPADSGVHGPLGLFLLLLRHCCGCVGLTDGRKEKVVVVVVVVVCLLVGIEKEVVSSLAGLRIAEKSGSEVMVRSESVSKGKQREGFGRKSWARGQIRRRRRK